MSVEDIKDVHSSLRKAAGIYQMVMKDLLPLLERGLPGSDLDPKVLQAYFSQSTAEAQEVTVGRAIELQHTDNLISSLAFETSQLFDNSKNQLKGLSKNVSEQWILYLDIKKNIYLAFVRILIFLLYLKILR